MDDIEISNKARARRTCKHNLSTSANTQPSKQRSKEAIVTHLLYIDFVHDDEHIKYYKMVSLF